MRALKKPENARRSLRERSRRRSLLKNLHAAARAANLKAYPPQPGLILLAAFIDSSIPAFVPVGFDFGGAAPPRGRRLAHRMGKAKNLAASTRSSINPTFLPLAPAASAKRKREKAEARRWKERDKSRRTAEHIARGITSAGGSRPKRPKRQPK